MAIMARGTDTIETYRVFVCSVTSLDNSRIRPVISLVNNRPPNLSLNVPVPVNVLFSEYAAGVLSLKDKSSVILNEEIV